jgi:hypothetical protein
MDIDELLDRAQHFRTLATRVTDAETSEGLIELADNYEALANEMAQEESESKYR